MNEQESLEFLANMQEQRKEHHAWIEMCDVIEKAFGISKDDFNHGEKAMSVVRAIERWGMSLVKLRLYQKANGIAFDENRGIFTSLE